MENQGIAFVFNPDKTIKEKINKEIIEPEETNNKIIKEMTEKINIKEDDMKLVNEIISNLEGICESQKFDIKKKGNS